MKCAFPNICVWYSEEINHLNNLKKPVCILHEFEINYHNLNKIENCEKHQTYQQIKENWKMYLQFSN